MTDKDELMEAYEGLRSSLTLGFAMGLITAPDDALQLLRDRLDNIAQVLGEKPRPTAMEAEAAFQERLAGQLDKLQARAAADPPRPGDSHILVTGDMAAAGVLELMAHPEFMDAVGDFEDAKILAAKVYKAMAMEKPRMQA